MSALSAEALPRRPMLESGSLADLRPYFAKASNLLGAFHGSWSPVSLPRADYGIQIRRTLDPSSSPSANGFHDGFSAASRQQQFPSVRNTFGESCGLPLFENRSLPPCDRLFHRVFPIHLSSGDIQGHRLRHSNAIDPCREYASGVAGSLARRIEASRIRALVGLVPPHPDR
jgi:hypothetical protein